MSSNLIKLLLATVAAIFLGFIAYPIGGWVLDVLNWRDNAAYSAQAKLDAERKKRLAELEQKRIQREKERLARLTVEITDDSAGDDWDQGFEDDDAIAQTDDDTLPDDNYAFENGDAFTESDSSSYMVGDIDPSLISIPEEAEIPEIEGQTDVVPAPADFKKRSVINTGIRKFVSNMERDQKKPKRVPYTNDEFMPEAWKKPGDIYKTVSERVLQKLGKASTEEIFNFLDSPENRLDLARLTLIRKVGIEAMEEVAKQRYGTTTLHQLGRDLDWMTNLMYSGPTEHMDRGLKFLATIFSRYSEDISDETVRRIATTTAMEFGREGWSEKDMLERFSYYYTSYREKKLNKIFDTLEYWETRFVTGNRECHSWGSPQSLTWQRDNVRLPVEGYLGACTQLVYRLRNTAGDSVFSSDYLAPILKHVNNITALAHREIGGVCGACSHYGAYGALAAGIPAMTMGEPGHCAYTVRVGNEWKKSYSIYWQHSTHKTFWGLHDWEFLILTQNLYSDRYKTLASDQLTALAELLAAKRMTRSAMNCFDAATMAQPLNWPAWISYAGYLKQKGIDNKARWRELSDRATDTLGSTYHNAAATLQARYIYPQLLPLIPDRKERNKLFAAFFKKCKGFGVHTWNIAPLLDAQFAGCRTDAEKLNYMKESLSILMRKQDYAGPVLAWGLELVSKMPEPEPGKAGLNMQDEFSKLIMRSMSHLRSGKKDRDATWGSLGEAIFTAASNGDTHTFNAIGKLAMAKCKDHFPKHKIKFRPFSGKVVSMKGLITTATTLDGNAVKQCCLHWGVLQKTGGSIPIKFEGKSGITVKLEGSSDMNGVVALFDVKIKNDRPFYLETSEDGQNWTSVQGRPSIEGSVMRFDLKKAGASGRFVRLLREGDKWNTGHIVGFYVYGKQKKA